MQVSTEIGTSTSTAPMAGVTEAKNARAEKTRAATSFHPILKDAIREVRDLSRKAGEIEEKRRQVSFVAIGRLHELRATATTDTSLMHILEEEARLPRRKNTSDHLYVVKAVHFLAGSELKAQTASDWSKVLRGLELAGVKADCAQVVEWLKTPEDGAEVTGHAKAFAIVDRAAKDGPPNVAADARAAKQAEKKQQAWTDYVTPKLDAPLGEVILSEPLSVVNGYVLQLVRIDGRHAKVIETVMTDEAEIQRVVLRQRSAT
jgi:hypothetical protein